MIDDIQLGVGVNFLGIMIVAALVAYHYVAAHRDD